MVFAPDGQTALSGSSDGTAILWAVPSGEVVRRYEGHTAAVNGVAFSPDGNTFISGSDDMTLIQWNVESGDIVRRYEGHTDVVNCVAFSPDGNTFISGSDDMTLIQWNVESGDQVMVFEGQGASISGAAITPKGQVVSTARNGSLILWNAITGTPQRQQQFASTIPSMALAPDGRAVLVPELGQLRAWNIEQWQQSYSIAYYETGKPEIASVAFSANGRMGVQGYEENSLTVWYTPSTGEIRRFGDAVTRFSSVVTSLDGCCVLGGTFAGDVIVLDRESGVEIRRFGDHVGLVYRMKFSADGRYVLVVSSDFFGDSGTGSITLWEVETGALIQSFEGYRYIPVYADFSPNGQFVIGSTMQWGDVWDAQDFGETIIWNRITGEEVMRLNTEWWVNQSGFTPNGNRIFTASGMSDVTGLVFWDISSGQRINQFLPTMPVLDALIVPNSTTMLAGLGSGETLLIDYETGEVIRHFCCHSSWVRYVDLSTDQRYVISGDNSGLVILWDFATGLETRRFYGHQNIVWSVAFSPDGQTAYSAGTDGNLIEWQVADQPLDELLAWVHENRYIRDFTCEERAQYRIEPLCEQ